MNTYFLLWLLAWLIVYLYVRINKYRKTVRLPRTEPAKPTIPPNNDAYEQYAQWAQRKNEQPITLQEYNQLKDESGNVNLSPLLRMHEKLNINSYNNLQPEPTVIAAEPDTATTDEAEKRKQRDNQFLVSAVVGYVTDSALTGKIVGGSWLGGIIGSRLKNNPQKPE